MTDKTNLIREIHEYVTAHGGENTATHTPTTDKQIHLNQNKIITILT